MKLIPEAKQWYKMASVQAAIALAMLETIQLLGYPLPEQLSIFVALMIPVLRIVKQEAIKHD